jgi:hypothetical protein
VSSPGDDLGDTYWFGVFEDTQTILLKDSLDSIGTIKAREGGTVLDQIPLIDLHMEDLSHASASGIIMQTPPEFNQVGLVEGDVIGNMIPAASSADGNPQFANSPAHCNTSTALWDRWSMLSTVLAYCASESAKVPPLTLNASTTVQALLQVAVKEVISTKGLTLKGLLDLLVGGQRGLFWSIYFSSVSGWEITLWSGTDIAVGAIPAANIVNASLTGTDDTVVLHGSAYDDYDAVQIDGNPIICCGTLSYIDATLGQGWSALQESDYFTGATGISNWNSANLTWDQRVALNRQYRSQGLMKDVYTRYIVAQDSSGRFNCKGVSGVPVAGSTQFLCPQIAWSGTVATVTGTASNSPNAVEARLQSQLPWPQGVQGNGTDIRNTEQQARPSYLEPMVFSYHHPVIYQVGDSFPNQWVDLCHPPSSLWSATPSVAIDDRGPGLRVSYSYQEMLGKNHYTAGPFDEYDPNVTPTADGHDNPASDWQQMAVTIAIPSDQRVRVINYRSGYSATSIRNTLRVERPDINCWLVRAHTFIGMSLSTGFMVPDEVAVDTFVRNDWAVAQKLCDELAAYAFRKRTGATITLVGVNAFPTWGQIGNMVGTVTEQDGITTYTLNTMVTNIYFNFSESRPRTVLTISDPPMPESHALVPQIPALGGQISAALGTTLAAHSQKVGAALKQVSRAIAGIPVVDKPESPDPVSLYGFVNWVVNASGDASVAELCSGQQTRVTPSLVVAVSFAASVMPTAFGNIAYRLEFIGYTTRSGKSVRTYRAMFPMNRTNGIVPRMFIVSGSLGDSNGAQVAWGTVADHTQQNITTQINSANQNNYLPVLMPVASGSGDYLDLPSPPTWTLSGSGSAWSGQLPCLIPAIVALARMGGVIPGSNTYDRGEIITIDVYVTFTSGAYAGCAVGKVIMAAGGTTCSYAGMITPGGIGSPATWGGSGTPTDIPMGSYAYISITFTGAGGKLSPTIYVNPNSGTTALTSKSIITGGRGPNWAGVG